jgi:hypothetical protein
LRSRKTAGKFHFRLISKFHLTASSLKNLPTRQADSPHSRVAQFLKRRQLFIRVHNETLSVAAMRVSNPDCSPLSESMAET